MPQLNRDDFMARINSRLGDDNSEDALNFIRDMADTTVSCHIINDISENSIINN